MKPLRLTLTAVGPYAGTQVIDFSLALENRLFGIYGPTGAGKSTIFNAMTFALFGESAKEGQRPISLRSDHADPQTPTKVEFVFENQGRVYRVVRSPEQMRPVRKGTGETKEPASAALFDITEVGIDAASEKTPGKVIAEKKVDLVNKEIARILGYGLVQFRQIVLLPQGRFEAFLTATTPERLNILNDLFDVSIFRNLTERIREKANAAEDEVKSARLAQSQILSNDGFESLEALQAAITLQTDELLKQQGAALAAKANAAAASQAYQIAALADRAFAEHAKADLEVKTIAAEAAAISSLKTRLQQARTAETLLDLERSVEEARLHAEKQAEAAHKFEQRLEAATGAAQKAAATLSDLSDKGAQHGLDEHHLRQHQTYVEFLLSAAPLRDDVNRGDAQARTDKDLSAGAKRHHEKQSGLLTAVTQQLDHERQTALQRAELAKREAELNTKLALARSYEQQQGRIASDCQRLSGLNDAATKAEGVLRSAQTAFDEAEQALLRDQALYVASHLQEGEPCPACGSFDHPAPAHGVSDRQFLAGAYQKAKTALDDARKRAEEARTQAQSARDILARRESEFAELTVPEMPASFLEAQIIDVRSETKALGPALDLEALDAKKKALEREVQLAVTACQTTEATANASDKSAALAKQALEKALSPIPVELHDQLVLNKRLEALRNKIGAYKTALENAQNDEKETRETAIGLQGIFQTAMITAATARDQHVKVCATFADRLAAAGMSEAQFQAAKADLAEASDLDGKIADHRERAIRADGRLQSATAAIANIDRPDIQVLKDQKDAAEAAETEANNTAIKTQSRLLYLQNLSDSTAKEAERLNRLEDETGPLRELAAAFTGKNDAKMTLETYAISAMFDEVLEAANLRFDPMSSGRYTLIRETEGFGNNRRGLGLAVEDAFTGRPRPTSTLSGGETFMAALSLALGLSDVVESRHGSVRLDTIFIDEGFGSLDAEGEGGSLESVLESLQKVVGQNRAVGLISHVALVQQAIPNGFWIKKTTTGSSIEIRGS